MLAGTQTPTSEKGRFRAGNGEKRGLSHRLGTEAQATGAEPTQHTRNPALLPQANPQPHGVHSRLSQGPFSCYHLEIETAPAGFTRSMAQPSARSQERVRRTPTSGHSCFAGNAEERVQTQHTRSPALFPLANPQPHGVHSRLSQGTSSCYRLEIATAPAGFTRPVAQP